MNIKQNLAYLPRQLIRSNAFLRCLNVLSSTKNDNKAVKSKLL